MRGQEIDGVRWAEASSTRWAGFAVQRGTAGPATPAASRSPRTGASIGREAAGTRSPPPRFDLLTPCRAARTAAADRHPAPKRRSRPRPLAHRTCRPATGSSIGLTSAWVACRIPISPDHKRPGQVLDHLRRLNFTAPEIDAAMQPSLSVQVVAGRRSDFSAQAPSSRVRLGRSLAA